MDAQIFPQEGQTKFQNEVLQNPENEDADQKDSASKVHRPSTNSAEAKRV
tara:strand:+ start:1267 stop:1416 length:150 start_codon:yes stop_codon:yes gene_type:complete